MAYRIVNQSFWTDEKIVDEYSVEDKYFFLYLLTNPQCNQLGIYKLPIKIAAFQLGYSNEQVIVLLNRFENKLNRIKYNKTTQEIAIANYLNYSIVSGGKPVIDCIEKDISLISDNDLFNFVVDRMKNKQHKNNTVTRIIEIIKEKIKKKINNKYNDNDNDNSVSYHVSSSKICNVDITNDTSNFKQEKKTDKKTYALDVFEEINEKMQFSSELSTAFMCFLEFRKEIKKPATKKALELILKDFEKWQYNDSQKIEALENSIKSGYQGVFQLRVQLKGVNQNGFEPIPKEQRLGGTYIE